MSASNKVYYRNFLTMLSGNSLSQLIPFIIAPVLSRIFSPEEFAVLANFMAIVGVIGIISTGRLELAIPIPQDHKKAQEIVFTGLIITLLLGVLSVLIPIFAYQISALYKDDQLAGYLWMVPFSVVSFGLLGLTNNWNLRHEKFHLLSIGKIVQSIVNNGLAALLGYIGWGINGLIIAWLLSQYVNIFILLVGVNRKVSYKDFGIVTLKTTLKEYKDFPLINSLHAFTDIFITQFLLYWVISSYFGFLELGLFAMMNKYVKAPIVLISSSVSQLFYVEAGKAINQGISLFPIVKKTVRTSVLFAIPFTIVLLVLGPWIFKIYLGNKWEIAGVYAQCLAPMLFLYFILSPISGLPILLNKQKGAFIFSVLGYSFTILALFFGIWLNLNFTKTLMLYGAAFALFYFMILVWYYTLIKRQNARIN
jgi:O-antigen/teichoic acid export membrane protein